MKSLDRPSTHRGSATGADNRRRGRGEGRGSRRARGVAPAAGWRILHVTRPVVAAALAAAVLCPPAVAEKPPRADAAAAPQGLASAAAADAGLPYVYTRWEQYTVEDGLPDDHVFCVRADGDHVWVGTEKGLARLDKRTGKIEAWGEDEGLPWRVVSALDVDPATGDLWIGLFGGGLSRFSGGRFDHLHQLNSGLVNDVVYGVAVQDHFVWAVTTAGASRLNTRTGEWTIYNEKNAPMEEIWNYGISVDAGKVYLAVWGSGILEYDVATGRWKEYLDPDGEMEIDLYRDDGIVHVITTGVSHVDGALWVGTYFGGSRYDGRHWRGIYAHETGLPSDFINAVRGRSAAEAWFSTDEGLGVLADFETDTWVTYTRAEDGSPSGQAVIRRGDRVLRTVDTGLNIPHNYVLWVDLDGRDAWVGTSKGLARAVGAGYHAGLRPAGHAKAPDARVSDQEGFVPGTAPLGDETAGSIGDGSGGR